MKWAHIHVKGEYQTDFKKSYAVMFTKISFDVFSNANNVNVQIFIDMASCNALYYSTFVLWESKGQC